MAMAPRKRSWWTRNPHPIYTDTMTASKNCKTIDYSQIVTARGGDPINGPDGKPATLGTLAAIALDNAIDRGPQGAPVTLTPGEIRKRIEIADAVQHGGSVTLPASDVDLIEQCIALHYIPAVAGRALACMVPAAESEAAQ